MMNDDVDSTNINAIDSAVARECVMQFVQEMQRMSSTLHNIDDDQRVQLEAALKEKRAG